MGEEEIKESEKEIHPEETEDHAQLPEPSESELLQSKVLDLENSVNQLKDQLLRKAAEFENYKKRMENDYANMVKFSNEALILNLLPVMDDFDRSMKAYKAGKDASNNGEAVSRGIELIYNKLKKILETQGVQEFESAGKPFDAYYHDALLQIQNSDLPHNTVIEEVEKGYLLFDKVIRHAKVIVSSREQNTEDINQNGKTGATDESENRKSSG